MAETKSPLGETLQNEITWLQNAIHQRFETHPALEYDPGFFDRNPPPPLDFSDSDYAELIRKHQFGVEERFLLILAMAPIIFPGALNELYARSFSGEKKSLTGKTFLSMNAQTGAVHPTAETFFMLVAGNNLAKRSRLFTFFDNNHPFWTEQLLELETDPQSFTRFSGRLKLSADLEQWLVFGRKGLPEFSNEFPARQLTTELEWDDLVLAEHTWAHLASIERWISHGHMLRSLSGMEKRVIELLHHLETKKYGRFTRIYDENGNKLSEKYESKKSEEWVEKKKFLWEYDQQGRKVKFLVEQQGQKILREEWKYENDDPFFTEYITYDHYIIDQDRESTLTATRTWEK